MLMTMYKKLKQTSNFNIFIQVVTTTFFYFFSVDMPILGIAFYNDLINYKAPNVGHNQNHSHHYVYSCVIVHIASVLHKNDGCIHYGSWCIHHIVHHTHDLPG